MVLLDKVLDNVNICDIEISFVANLLPSIDPLWQPFYNATIQNNDFTPTYFSKGSIDFKEESETTSAGIKYKQKFSFRFPCADAIRAERISLLLTAKFLRFKLTNGFWLTVGRNDYFQNTKPLLKIKTNKQLCDLEGETQSIYPTAYSK